MPEKNDSLMVLEPEPVFIKACPHPFKTSRADFSVGAGLTVAEILAVVQPDPVLMRHAHVFIGDVYIPRAHWSCVRPKAGVLVNVRVVPMDTGGGGKKNPLRTILQIAVVVAAIAASVYTAGATLEALGPIGSALAGAAAGGAVTIAGSLLVNAVAPPGLPRLQERDLSSEPTFSLSGARNRLNPFGPVPVPLGRHRMTPPLGAKSFTEIVGDDQYLRMLVVWGVGPVQISDLKIGETPLSEFQDVETETRQGFDADTPLTLFSNQVNEEALTIELKQVNGWITRTTQQGVDEISVDISFPAGVFVLETSDGSKKQTSVQVDVEYAVSGSGIFVSAGSIVITDARSKAIRKGLRWPVTNGQYDVRVKRITQDYDNDPNAFTQSFWTALRSIVNKDPINAPNIAKTALRIRANGQLSGVLDNLNGIVESLCKDWDGANWVTDQPTRNPASLFRHVLQHTANKKALADSRVDLTNLEEWHNLNSANGREFNMIIDFSSSVSNVLDLIAGAARARKTLRDGKWGVVIDKPQTVPVQHVTPNNSWGFSGTKVFLDQVHGFRVRFINRDKGYQEDERLVFDDGYDESNATNYEGLELPGIVDPGLVWKEGRYHIAVARLRPESYTFNQDWEHLVYTRGDLIRAAHDVPLWGVGSGRVKTVQTSGTDTTGVTLDELLTMEAGKTYNLRFRKKDGTSLLKSVTTVPGETNTFVFTSPITSGNPVPEVDDLSMFGEFGLESAELIVKEIRYQDDITAQVTCVDAAPAVHTADSGPIPPFNSLITSPTDLSRPVVNEIRSDENVLLISQGGEYITRILITLGFVQNRESTIESIETQYRPTGSTGEWEKQFDPENAEKISLLEVEDLQTYDIRLRFYFTGGPGKWTETFMHPVVGTSTPPPDVPNLLLENNVLRWIYPNAPIDFMGFRLRVNDGSNVNWENGQPLHDGVISETTFPLNGVPRGTKTIMIRAFDTSENPSANVTSIVRDLGDVLVDNVVETVDLDADGFPGTIANGTVVGSELQADSFGTPFWTQNSDPFWSGNNDPFWTDQYKQMIYEHSITPDPSVLDAILKLDLSVVAENWSIEYKPDNQAKFWTKDADPFWTQDSDPFWNTNDPAYKVWPGELSGLLQKKYWFRLITQAGRVQGKITNFDVVFDVPDQIERINDFVVAAGGARLPITKSFRSIKNVELTLHDDAGTAITAKIIDKNETLGPLIKTLDSSSVSVQGLIDATVQGVKGQ